MVPGIRGTGGSDNRPGRGHRRHNLARRGLNERIAAGLAAAARGGGHRRLATLSDPAVQAEWDTFREAMRQESDRSGPVQRKVPKSPEPPERVWLRDYFALAVATWVVLVGVLGGFLGLLVVGVSGRPPSGPGSGGPSGPPPETGSA